MVTAISTHRTPRFIGEPMTRMYDVETATIVIAGSLVCHKDATTNKRYVTPVTTVADGGDATANREAVADLICGIAIDASGTGDTDPIRVAVAPTQVYLEQQTAAAIHAGDMLEIYADATGGSDEHVVEGSTSQIATCIKTKASTADKWVPSELIRTKIQTAEEQS